MLVTRHQYESCLNRDFRFHRLTFQFLPTAALAVALLGGILLVFVSSGARIAAQENRRLAAEVRIPAELRNRWPDQLEREFRQRCDYIIDQQSQLRVSAGNTYFENEKRTYGYLMAQAIGSRGMEAIRDLQLEDAQREEWHRETAGIDFYAAFTLKHQVRKYFLFRDHFEPEYRNRMFEGAKRWTERDPLRRAHYAFDQPKQGWGPDARNSWVDVRSTENLFLMRVCSVYLMAEETGNQQTAAIYKEQINRYTQSLYRIGMGEWDSENYHGHSIAPLLNLYDFARDEQIKRCAKACLDWMMAAGAIKYFKGGFNGPTKRDYNHVQPFGGSAPTMLWVYFGDAASPPSHWESDEVHLITSAYRPPAAIVELARKGFATPVELFASKPHYSATTSFDQDSGPDYLETQFISRSFQMGSLAGGTRPGKQDVNGFKIVAAADAPGEDGRSGDGDNGETGVVIQGVPGVDPFFVGSPRYQEGKVSAENRVAQFENLAIWLVKDGSSPWTWLVPDDFELAFQGDIALLHNAHVMIAMHPLGVARLSKDEQKTQQVLSGERVSFPGHYVLSSQGGGDVSASSEGSANYCGFAIEVCEASQFRDLNDFKRHVRQTEPDSTRLSDGIVQFNDQSGRWLGFHWNDDPHNLGAWRNGQRHDWQQHAEFLYRTDAENEGRPVVFSEWGSGELRVDTPDAGFSTTINEDFEIRFENRVR